MKIALFTDTYLPQINGVATHVKTLKEGLELIGHEVLVVTADAAATKHYIEDNVLRCPAAVVKRLYGYGVAAPYSVERQHFLDDFSFDLVHVHTEFGIGLSGAEAADSSGVPLIYTLHTMWDQYLHYIAPQTFLPIAKKAERAYIRRFAGWADEIIGPSVRVQDFLASCGVHRNINIVPNAVELDYFSVEQVDRKAVKELRESYRLSEEDLVLCFCGRLGEEKSVDVLLNLYAAYHRQDDHIKLMIIGDGPMRIALEEQSYSLGIAESVIFAGGIPHSQMREVYACCDLYATASRSEVNSISMLEAMAMGLPVLHILDEENQGQITEGINGYTFRSAEEFYAALKRFRDNKEEQQRLRASTIGSVRTSSQESLARQVERVYLCGLEQACCKGS